MKPNRNLVPFFFGASAKGWHELEALPRCPKEYQYSRVRGISPRGAAFLKEPLGIGTLVHVGRAQWLADGYKGDRWREALALYLKEYKAQNLPPMMPGALAIAVQCLEKYIEYWSIRPKPEVLAVEYEMKARGLAAVSDSWTWRTSRLDSIVKWQGKTWLDECKTTSSSPSRVRDIYMLNGQPLLGCALWTKEETKRFGPLAGVLLDVIVKPNGKKGPSCSSRIPLPISEMSHALKWFPAVAAEYVHQARMIRWNDGVERRITSCLRPLGPCPFRALCLRGQRGAGGYVFADGVSLNEWKPEPGKETEPWR